MENQLTLSASSVAGIGLALTGGALALGQRSGAESLLKNATHSHLELLAANQRFQMH
jgi:hypothetical protein